MHHRVPEECFLNLPAEITAELARAFPEKINVLLQTQLLGRSVTDLDSALRLVLDLVGELVDFDRAAVLWAEEGDPLQLRASRGFDGPVPVAVLRELVPMDAAASRSRPLLATPVRCDHPVIQNLLAKAEASSLLSVPLQLDGQVQGALQLLREAGAPFTLEEAHLLRVFSLSVEAMLENLQHGIQPKSYAFLDRVTGLFNRRYFEQQLERELDRARRHSEPASTLLVEVEGMGRVCTAHGHLAGEAALQEVARALERVCRKSDTLAYYHGNLLAVILPRTGKADMGFMAQRVFGALTGPFLTSLPGASAGVDLTFSLSAATYPEDAFSPTTILEVCEAGLGAARVQHNKRRFHQPVPDAPASDKDQLLDPSRMGLFSEPLLESSRLLQLFARICLDSVPADRVSIMVREGEELVIQVAFGFHPQDEVMRTRRVRLDQTNVSSWVAQHKQPLLVRAAGDAGKLPTRGGSAYTCDSFFSYPLLQGDDLLGVVHFSNPSGGTSFNQQQVDEFAPLAAVITGYLALDRQFGHTQEQFLREALFSLVDATERQIPGMANHSQEVAALAEATARRLGFDTGQLERLRVSARLHDLGKVTYRSHILAADRALSPREQALTQRHPLLGWKVLEDVPLHCVDREAVLYHHEREDGSGYLHKQGGEIPEAAKVLAVADVYQALTSHRAYRPAVEPAEARAYLAGQKDRLFDGRVVDAMLASLAAGEASA